MRVWHAALALAVGALLWAGAPAAAQILDALGGDASSSGNSSQADGGGSGEKAPASEAGEGPEDPLGRETPRGAMQGFISAVERGHLERAASYLDLSEVSEDDGGGAGRTPGLLALVAAAVGAQDRAFGFQVTALLAGLGIGGVAVALAAQRTLGDLFGVGRRGRRLSRAGRRCSA